MSSDAGEPGYEESNWISMVDLMLVVLCLGIVFLSAAPQPDAQVASRVTVSQGDQTVDTQPTYSSAPSSIPGEHTVPVPTPEMFWGQIHALEDEIGTLTTQLQASSAVIAGQGAQIFKLGGEVERLTWVVRANDIAIAAKDGSIESLRGRISLQSDVEAQLRQELLGLEGSMNSVVFVVDRSASMAQSGRWDSAVKTVLDWIEHLPIKKVALVTFGGDVETVPEEIGASPAWRPDTREIPDASVEHRRRLATFLRELKPSGATRTADGLRRAMDFRGADAFILFTDGAPDSFDGGRSGDPREQVMMVISQWVSAAPGRRVHVVGIGDYFKGSMRDFLLNAAKAGSGTFIGR